VTTREIRERREAASASRTRGGGGGGNALPPGAPRLHLPAPARLPHAAVPPEALRPARARAAPAAGVRASPPPPYALRPALAARAQPPAPRRRDRGPFGLTLSFELTVARTASGPELRVRPAGVAVRAGPLAARAQGPPDDWAAHAPARCDAMRQARAPLLRRVRPVWL